ncbi:S8 family peptidase [Mangrovihabitans endophyticus]|uniref:Serine protease n=1 Tax=Mangrovihabitans endophyticus TaxID=1751298 RepID=A0A8J3FQV7_9ACTN|nr:S8/S53 family peptidase [Mangrovihabitans endophyticus]GGL04064.1 serine protease [Mangrovihabitans endophyticus]
MKFEKDWLGYAFEGDYPESYGPDDTARLRTVLQQQLGQLGQGGATTDDRLLGILIGRRCANSGRSQIEARGRRDGSLCMVARGEMVLPAADAPMVQHLLGAFQPPPAGAAKPGAHLRLRQREVGPSEVDRTIDAVAAARVTAWPNYMAAMAAVSKGVGGPEPAPAPGTMAELTAGLGPALRTVRVGVIDTGITQDLRGDEWLTGVPREDDNIDPLDQLPAGPDGLLDYQAGHGTFVAGVIQRVAPHADIRMYRAADSDGFATDHDIAEAILRAHDDGAQIINLSLGGRTADDQPPPATAEAIAAVQRESAGATVIIAAAGNNGDRAPVWPAALPGVEAVAGLTAYLTPSAWSSYGPDVRFSTVGEGIRSLFVTGVESPVFDPVPDVFGPDAWAMWSGTSFAAPQIAGAVARICYEEDREPRAAVDRLDEFGKPIEGFGKAMRVLRGLD